MPIFNGPVFGRRLVKLDVPTLIVSAAHGYCDQTNIPLPYALDCALSFLPTAIHSLLGIKDVNLDRSPYWSHSISCTDAIEVSRDKLRIRTSAAIISGGIGVAESLVGYWSGRGIGALQEIILKHPQTFS